MSKIIVIGGGVIGICCALELQQDGHQVTVIDPGPVGEGASWASCGSIAVSEIIPLSRPGTLTSAPKWLMDPEGPLALRASSAFAVLPWFLRFSSNARMSRIKKISSEISTLTLSALVDLQSLLARYDLNSLLRENPVLELYDSHEELSRERQFHDMRRALGFRIDEISGDEAKQMEPSISSSFACATVFQDWRSVIDARRFVVDLHAAFIARGGVVECDCVTAFMPDGLKVAGVRTKSGTIFSGDQYVLAAGIWSRQLARNLGLPIQMEGVIGYQASLKTPGIEINHALIYAKGGFGITPYESGLAVAGSIEFAHIDAKPNWKRADALLKRAQRVLPGLQTQSVEKRIGRRPLTPDTKPIIGRAPSVKNVILATGHGQLGLTLCATTGKLVSDIVANRTSNIDLVPFRPDRF